MTPTQYPRALTGAALLAASLALAPAAFAQDHADHAAPPSTSPSPEPPPAPSHHPMDMAGMDHGRQGMAPEEDMAGMDAVGGMPGALGDYPVSRDGSGTSWQPEETPHGGVHRMAGDWMLMGHVLLNGVAIDQGGPRGGDKTFLAGMVMGMATRDLGPGRLQLKAMLSPDPLMGAEGYPLLLQAGETADGLTPLIDRQHPHDLFMELAASWSVPVGEHQSLFVYGGLPGEPAYGPPAFMHRAAGLDSPEAPISHHWMDSTHITFGVITAGFISGRWKLEGSAFHGREPDEERWNIETGDLDSRSARLSFNPTPNWALQASWAKIISPEALEPDHDQKRVSASALYTRRFGSAGVFAGTLAWARKETDGEPLEALLLEAAVMPDDAWTVFARAERVDQNELGGGHGPAYEVGKLSVGIIHDWRLSDNVKLGLGGLVSTYDIASPLSASYGDPTSGAAFVRLKIG